MITAEVHPEEEAQEDEAFLIQKTPDLKGSEFPPATRVRKRDWCGAMVILLYVPAYVGL